MKEINNFHFWFFTFCISVFLSSISPIKDRIDHAETSLPDFNKWKLSHYVDPKTTDIDGPDNELPKIELVFVKGSSFEMGSNLENANEDEKPVHSTKVDDFYIGKYEITVAHFNCFAEATGYFSEAELQGFSYSWNGSSWEKQKGINWKYNEETIKIVKSKNRYPVIHITLKDAQEFCKWLSRKTKFHYRLPTEAEWEFAAKGGVKSKGYQFSGSDNTNKISWNADNSEYKIHETGLKLPNELGIHDMSGNVWEWCEDIYDPEAYTKLFNGKKVKPASNSPQVKRGGSWMNLPKYMKTTYRNNENPKYSCDYIGFRIVREVK